MTIDDVKTDHDQAAEVALARGLLLNLYPEIVVNGLEASGRVVQVAKTIAAVVHALYPTSPLR